MATLQSIASSNFTTSTTWALIDNSATTGVSYLDSEANSTVLTTTASANETASFLWAVTAPTADGVAVKIAARASSPSGTVTMVLRNNDAGTDVKTVTINVSDIVDSGDNGWYFFKFDASIALTNAVNYRIRVYTSASSQVTLYRDATATNWSRMLRTTTTQAPASADQLHVIGEWTAAATLASYTVTMDNTATTSFGPTVSGGPPQGVTVGIGGTWTNGTAASTAYYFKWKGIFKVYPSGTVNIGTSGTRMPSTSSAVYEMDCVANVDTGINVTLQATFNAYGDNGRLYMTYLNTDEAAAATVIGLVSTSGWANSDEIVFAPTSSTSTQFEKRTITTVDSATQVTISAGLTNAHSGTAPIAGEVGNITRNVKFRGLSVSLSGWLSFGATSTVVLDYVSASFIGSGTSQKRGIELFTTTASATINKCAIYDGNTSATASSGIYVSGGTANNFTITDNVIYNFYTSCIFLAGATSGTSYTVSGNLCIATASTGAAVINLSDVGGTFTNNIACAGQGANLGFSFAEAAVALGTVSGNIAHSNAGSGFSITSGESGTLTNCTSWRNVNGFNFGTYGEIILDTCTAFGNTSTNIRTLAGEYLTLNSCVIYGGVTTVAPFGIKADGPATIIGNSTTFGVGSAHSTADMTVTVAGVPVLWKFNNCLFSTSTEFSTNTNMTTSSYVGSEKHDQTAGTHKFWRRYGTGTIDTTASMFDVTPSLRMTPNNASGKLECLPFQMVVASGTAITASIKVRESVVGDGTDYNGNRIRLIVKRNDSLGITSDTVLATATVASAGAFETISGTTASVTDDGVLDFVVDCDGTTGWINADTFTATPNLDSRGLNYWKDGSPVAYGSNGGGGGGSYTFS